MPEKKTLERAKKAKKEGKAPTTQAGEFIREEIHHIREGEHGARSAKQAIAIGLSKARRAGVDLPLPKKGKYSEEVREQANRESARAKDKTPVSKARSKAAKEALEDEPKSAGSHLALTRQAKAAARKRTPAERSEIAKKAAATRRRNKAA